MQVVHKIALLISSLILALALGLAGDGQSAARPLGDDGPNAQLSNEELLARALVNMQALQSYHYEFDGVRPSLAVTPAKQFTVSGDVQLAASRSRLTMVGTLRGPSGPITLLDLAFLGMFVPAGATQSFRVDAILDGKQVYMSGDHGKTWRESYPNDYARGMLAFGCSWAESGTGTGCSDLITGLSFQDGTPRGEQVDGVATRHMVATLGSGPTAPGFFAQEARTISLWISTDSSPTIRKLQIEAVAEFQAPIEPATDVAFSPDGRLLALAVSGLEQWRVVVWDLSHPGEAPQQLRSSREAGTELRSVAFSPDGKILAAGLMRGRSSKIMVWDTANLSAAPGGLSVPGTLGAVAFQPGGPRLAAGTSTGVYLWTPPFNTTEPSLVPGSANRGGAFYYALAFSPDGNRLVFGAADGVQIYDLSNPQTAPTTLATGDVKAVAFSADGDHVAANGAQLRIWNLRRPEMPPIVLPGVGDGPAPLAFSPDGRFLAAGNTVQVWDLSRLAAAAGTPTPVQELKGQCLVYTLAFSPDGNTLAGGCYETTVRLWDVRALAQAGKAAAPTSTLLSAVDRPADLSYSLTWQWSRFNEDFGPIQAPPLGPAAPGAPPPSSAGPPATPPTPAPPVGMPSTGRANSAPLSLLPPALGIGLLALLAGGLLRRVARGQRMTCRAPTPPLAR